MLQVKATKISKQRECNCEKWFVVANLPYIFLYTTLAQCKQFLKIGDKEYNYEDLRKYKANTDIFEVNYDKKRNSYLYMEINMLPVGN
jgi:hypothetical protein